MLTTRPPKPLRGRLKRSGRDFDHSPPSSAEVKSEWSCTSVLAACTDGVEGEIFTFYVMYANVIKLHQTRAVYRLCAAFRSTCRVGMLDMKCAVQLLLCLLQSVVCSDKHLGSCGLEVVVRVVLRCPRSFSPSTQIK